MRKRILIVDDDEDMIELLRFNLERAGFAISAVVDGNAAIKAAHENPPDLVLLDLMLPGMNGFTVCETLRRDAVTAAIPVIMLTAMPGQFCKMFGYELGASEFLAKPFSVRALVAKIRSILAADSSPSRNKSVTTLLPGLNCALVGDMLLKKREAEDTRS